MKKRLRIGMIGGGIGGQVGKWHRHAMSLDNKYELVAGCFSSNVENGINSANEFCLLYTSPSPRDLSTSRMPSSA